MKRLKLLALAVLTLMGFCFPNIAVAQTPPPLWLSATPRYDIPPYELNRGKDVQKFSGLFVQRLAESWSFESTMDCLRSLGETHITFQTFASGELFINAPLSSCAAAKEKQVTSSKLTSEVSIAANRILALILVARRFSTEPRFKENDRDVSHYDVEIYEKSGSFKVFLNAPPSPIDALVAGCPPSGPITAPYSVDAKSFEVQLGHMVC